MSVGIAMGEVVHSLRVTRSCTCGVGDISICETH